MYSDPSIKPFSFRGKEIELIFGDITEVHADAIISSDDNHLSMGGGVSMAIHNAGGERIWEESRKYIHAPVGTAVVTSAGDLSARYVIHALVIDYDAMTWPDAEIVQNATKSCIEQAHRLGCHSMAIPALATGAGSLPSEVAAQTMLTAILNDIEQTCIQKVMIVLNRQDTLFDFFKSSIENTIRSEYTEQLNQLKQEKDKLITQLREKSPYRDLPFPIAITRHLIESHTAYHSKFTSAIECTESIIKYCTAITLAEYLKITPGEGKTLFTFFTKNASLGSWVMQLEQTLKYLHSKKTCSIIPKIHSFYFSPNKGYLNEIINIRNTEHAHGSTRSDDTYKGLYENVIKKLDKIIEQLDFFNEYLLSVITQTDVSETAFNYEIVKLVGDNVIFPKGSLSFASLRLSKNTLYVIDQHHQETVSLAPFLIFETCQVCHIQETFFLEITNESESTYHTYRSNHRLRTDKYLKQFRLDK